MRFWEILTEAEKPKVGRALQHAEDLVIVDGSIGAMRAVNELAKMADTIDDVTVKWDGSPAVVFGRDENGQFILTDKSGFEAKGYNGRASSAEELEQMFLTRGKSEPDDARRAFAGNMKNIFPAFEAAVDPSVRGFFKGDLLYQTPPPLTDDTYNFTPNIVTYSIPKGSTLGKAISQSVAGVVIHSFNDQSVKLPFKGLTSGELLIVGPTTVNRLPQIDTAKIKQLGAYVKAQAAAIDGLLDDQRLAAEKMSDFKATLYKFVNQQVDTGDLTNLNKKFDNWVASSGLSAPKKAKIQDYRANHVAGFDAVFGTLERIMQVKDSIIDQLDAADELGQNIAGQKGGEGYVKGDIKLVPRARFTAANRAKMR